MPLLFQTEFQSPGVGSIGDDHIFLANFGDGKPINRLAFPDNPIVYHHHPSGDIFGPGDGLQFELRVIERIQRIKIIFYPRFFDFFR